VWAIFFLVMVVADLVIYGYWGMPKEPEIASLLYDYTTSDAALDSAHHTTNDSI
jgi:hypothetical protein